MTKNKPESKRPAKNFFEVAFPLLLKKSLDALQAAPDEIRNQYHHLVYGGPVWVKVSVADGTFWVKSRQEKKGLWKMIDEARSLTGAGNVSHSMSALENYNRTPVSFLNAAWVSKIAQLWSNHFLKGHFKELDLSCKTSPKDIFRPLQRFEILEMIYDLRLLQWEPKGAKPPAGFFPLYHREFLARAANLVESMPEKAWNKLQWLPSKSTQKVVKREVVYNKRQSGPAFRKAEPKPMIVLN